MKQILVTGANGLLGQKIILALKDRRDVELVATSRGKNRLASEKGYFFESMDLTDQRKTEEVIAKHRPDVMIHTAAMTQVDDCERQRDLCWKLNVTTVGNLIRICEVQDIHLVHLSTDFVFDGAKGPYREDDLPHPQSVYAESKLASEQLLQASKIKWTILRTILLYGVAESTKRSNIVLWIKSSLEQGKAIQVVTDQVRMPTLAEDLADACIAAALKGAAGIYHVSGKDLMSIYQMAKEIADFFKLDASLMTPTTSDQLNLPAKRPAVTGFILDKAMRDLNYKPHSFLEGLEIVKQQLANLK